MNWFVLALFSSITLSLRESFVKSKGKAISPMFMSWGMNLIMFVIILVITAITSNFCPITPSFALILIIAAVLDSMASVLYFSAIHGGDLSKTVPMLCFIPVVQLFVTPVLVQENLSAAGIAGVLIVVSGSYLLNLKGLDSIFSPFKVMFKEKSILMMLGVALIWGISSSFHKIGVQQTNPFFWGVMEIGLIVVFLLPFAMVQESSFSRSMTKIKKAFWPAVFSALTVLSYYWAIDVGPVAYVSSVRRLGVLFSMLAGMFFFKERLGPTSFSGGMIMIFGAVIITLFG